MRLESEQDYLDDFLAEDFFQSHLGVLGFLFIGSSSLAHSKIIVDHAGCQSTFNMSPESCFQ